MECGAVLGEECPLAPPPTEKSSSRRSRGHLRVGAAVESGRGASQLGRHSSSFALIVKRTGSSPGFLPSTNFTAGNRVATGNSTFIQLPVDADFSFLPGSEPPCAAAASQGKEGSPDLRSRNRGGQCSFSSFPWTEHTSKEMRNKRREDRWELVFCARVCVRACVWRREPSCSTSGLRELLRILAVFAASLELLVHFLLGQLRHQDRTGALFDTGEGAHAGICP